MGKGRKKRGAKSGDNALKSESSLHAGEEAVLLKVAAESRHGPAPKEPPNPPACNAENTISGSVQGASSTDTKNKAPLDDKGSSFQAPAKSSVPCRFFQRGYCRYGDLCRFQHPKAAPGTTEIFNSAAKKHFSIRDKVLSEKTCAPEECLDWHLTGSCPRYRTCRYAHPIDCGVKGRESGTGMDSGMGYGGFEYMASKLLRHGLSGESRGGDSHDEMEQRMRNLGFTDDDVDELAMQGIKPWDPEAWDALAVLNGWDMDEDYDYGDYGYDYGY